MLLEKSQTIIATVSRIESYGIYLDYKNIPIFVRLPDVTWEAGPLETDKHCKLGSKTEAKITSVLDKEHFGCLYLGSIKDVHPENNPWLNAERYYVGARFSAEVIGIAAYGTLVKLSTGAGGLIRELSVGELKSRINVEIIDADVDRRRLLLRQIE